MKLYPDSSFVVCRYLPQVFSEEVDSRVAKALEEGHRLLLTPIQQVEVVHALYLQVFRGTIHLQQAQAVCQDFEHDQQMGIWSVTGLPPAVFERCKELATTFSPNLGVRTLDSLHVAAALELEADQFWTFDERQARLAATTGLKLHS